VGLGQQAPDPGRRYRLILLSETYLLTFGDGPDDGLGKADLAVLRALPDGDGGVGEELLHDHPGQVVQDLGGAGAVVAQAVEGPVRSRTRIASAQV